jgi:4-diphosphocytidyl-2-C-methyl-D-erythritol kinase
VTVRVPAKVNLQLSVGPVGADGYHPLATVFQAVSLYDEVTAHHARPGSGITVAVRGEDVSGVPLGPQNLAARAVAALAAHLGRPADVSLDIRKGIPVAGGMAGGSADAAGALVACATLWGCGQEGGVLAEVAASVGSDVPFLLLGGTAIGRGRGDELAPLPSAARFEWVFATAYEGLSTPEVYRQFDALAGAEGREVPLPSIDANLIAAVESGDGRALGALLRNDLQAAALALRPSLQALLDAGLAAGALGALVSGSGPTVAFLVDGDDAAMELALQLSPSRLCRSLRRAHGPVPGAQVVQ